MHSGHCGDDNGLETTGALLILEWSPFDLEHLIVVLVETDAKRYEVRLSPCDLRHIRCEGGDQIGARCAGEEVQGMTLAHAAEAGNSDS